MTNEEKMRIRQGVYAAAFGAAFDRLLDQHGEKTAASRASYIAGLAEKAVAEQLEQGKVPASWR